MSKNNHQTKQIYVPKGTIVQAKQEVSSEIVIVKKQAKSEINTENKRPTNKSPLKKEKTKKLPPPKIKIEDYQGKLLSPDELNNLQSDELFLKDKVNVRSIQIQGGSYVLRDFALKGQETKEPVLEDFLQNNVRSGGLSLIERTGGPKRTDLPKVQMVQRGLPKIYVQRNDTQNDGHLTVDEIIGSIERDAIKAGKEIEVVTQPKVNGISVNISYNQILDQWFVGTNQTCFGVSKQSEDQDRQERPLESPYQQARECWLQQISDLSQEQLADLKQAMINLTLVGFLITDNSQSEIRKLLKYDYETILFYSIVEHDNHEPCMLPENADEFFKHFGLRQLQFTSKCIRKAKSNIKDFKNILEQMQKDQQSLPLTQGEEGQLVYLVQRDQDKKDDKVLRIFQQVNYEHEILKNMMIVIRKFWDIKIGNPNQKLEVKDFINEFGKIITKFYSKSATTTHQVHMQYNYYMDLCVTGLYMLISGPFDKKKFYIMQLRSQFAQFVTNAQTENDMRSKKQKLYSHIKLTSELDARGLCDIYQSSNAESKSYVLDKIQQETEKQQQNQVELQVVKAVKKVDHIVIQKKEEQVQQQVIQEQKEQVKAEVKAEVKVKEKVKEVKVREVKVKEPEVKKDDVEKSQRKVTLQVKVKEESKVEEEVGQKSEEDEAKILVYLFMGLPGMGKTSFIRDGIKENLKCAELYVISSDEIREKLYKELIKEDPTISSESLYVRTAFDLMQQLDKALKSTILSCMQNPEKSHVIVLDKSLTSDYITKYATDIRKISKSVKIGLIVPQIPHDQALQNYPFSLNTLYQVIMRTWQRKNHPTLDHSDNEQKLKICCEWFQKYFNVSIEAQKPQVDEIIKIPFTLEHNDLELPLNLQNAFKAHFKYPNNQKDLTSLFNLLSLNFQLHNLHNNTQQTCFTPLYDIQPFIAQTYSLLGQPVKPKQISFAKPQDHKPNPKKIVRQVTKHIPTEQTQKQTQLKNPSKAQVTDGFETQISSRHKKTQQKQTSWDENTDSSEYESEGSDTDSIPLYLGVDLGDHLQEAQGVVMQAIEQVVSSVEKGQRNSNLRDQIEGVQNAWRFEQGLEVHGWKNVSNMHVTCLYVGRDKFNAMNEAYNSFQKNIRVEVCIQAIIFVPNKILTAICFEDREGKVKVANKCPHVTFSVNEWEAKESNTVLEQSCFKEKGPFSKQYNLLKRLYQEGRESVQTAKVQNSKVPLINKPSVNAFFITLDQPFYLSGTTKAFYY